MKIDNSLIDPKFKVKVLSATPNPQQVIYAALHQDYSEKFVYDELEWSEKDKYPTSSLNHPHNPSLLLTEEMAGEIAVRQLLKGKTFHGGPLEHPQIVLNYGYFPHSTMQQIRTHRVGISVDCQSMRYTGKRIYELGKYIESCFSSFPDLRVIIPGEHGVGRDIEDIFYIRPSGFYTDRFGKKYEVTEADRIIDLEEAGLAAWTYKKRIDRGYSEEHARGLIPFDVRQHWVLSANLRAIFHLMDMRYKADAQLECQIAMQLTIEHIRNWIPELWDYYEKVRLGKGLLAP